MLENSSFFYFCHYTWFYIFVFFSSYLGIKSTDSFLDITTEKSVWGKIATNWQQIKSCNIWQRQNQTKCIHPYHIQTHPYIYTYSYIIWQIIVTRCRPRHCCCSTEATHLSLWVQYNKKLKGAKYITTIQRMEQSKSEIDACELLPYSALHFTLLFTSFKSAFKVSFKTANSKKNNIKQRKSSSGLKCCFIFLLYAFGFSNIKLSLSSNANKSFVITVWSRRRWEYKKIKKKHGTGNEKYLRYKSYKY